MPKLIFAFLCTALLVSCSDDDTNVAEKPFFNFINLPEIEIDTVTNANAVWEYGFRFKPLKDGTINQLAILVPSLGSYEVKLYDLAKGTVLARATLTPANLHEATFKGINPVQIKAGDDLGLAIVADVFFKVKNLNGESFNFPQTVDNLNIISFNEEICGAGGCTVFPSSTNFQTIAPCVNLVFQAD